MNGVLPDWATMPPEARAAAYNNSLAVPGSDAIQARWREQAAAFRAAHPPREIVYGAHERQRIDLFAGSGRGIMVFVHGGYWQRGGREMVSHVAAGPLAAGWTVAIPGYRLAPEVTLTEIVADVRAALDALQTRGMVLAGHSAGGHLTACALDHPGVVAGMPISGVFELGPVREIYLNDALRLTEAEVATLSPLRLSPVEKPMAVVYGAIELPALIANSRDLFARRANPSDTLVPVAAADHFTILDGLIEPGGGLVAALQRLSAPSS